MATKLYVGNLAESTTEKSLRELFDAFGSVSEVAVLQGYGFVHFRRSEDAQAARQALNDTEFEGTRISVQISHTKGHGYGRGGSNSGHGGRTSGGDKDDSRGSVRGRYGEQQYSRNYDRGYYPYDRYDDRHTERYHSDRYHGDRYHSDHYGYPDIGRYRSEYREREYERYDYGYGGRSRSPFAPRDYYRDSQYERDGYREPYREEHPYTRDGYREYTRERHHYRPRY